MNALTRIDRPAPPDRELATVVSLYHGRLTRAGLNRWTIDDSQVWTAAERRMMEARHSGLRAGLAAGDKAAMAKAIGTMFLGFPSAKMDGDSAKATVALYVSRVAASPLWAIEAACRAAVSRDKAFPPSVGEFQALVRGATEAHHAELANLDAILTADVIHLPDAGERERVNAQFNALLDDLKFNAPADDRAPKYRQPTRTEADEWLQREPANPRPLPPLSDAARKSMGMAINEGERA